MPQKSNQTETTDERAAPVPQENEDELDMADDEEEFDDDDEENADEEDVDEDEEVAEE